MSAPDSRVTLHMVASLDGYIANETGDIDWMNTTAVYEQGVESEDPTEFLKTIDCYVMGARTYEHALALSREHGWAYGSTPTVVLSHRHTASDIASVQFAAGDIGELFTAQLRARYRNIWAVGGAAMARDLLRAGQVDDIRLVILPVLLGGGLPFFDHVGVQQALQLHQTKAYKNAMVELWYKLVKP